MTTVTIMGIKKRPFLTERALSIEIYFRFRLFSLRSFLSGCFCLSFLTNLCFRSSFSALSTTATTSLLSCLRSLGHVLIEVNKLDETNVSSIALA